MRVVDADDYHAHRACDAALMLQQCPTVPHVMAADVLGADGSKAWGMAHPGLLTVDLWIVDQDRRNLARLVLTRDACAALVALLAEMRDTLPG